MAEYKKWHTLQTSYANTSLCIRANEKEYWTKINLIYVCI